MEPADEILLGIALLRHRPPLPTTAERQATPSLAREARLGGGVLARLRVEERLHWSEQK